MQIGSDSRSSLLGLTLGLDLEGGTHLVYEVIPEDGRELHELINEDLKPYGDITTKLNNLLEFYLGMAA